MDGGTRDDRTLRRIVAMLVALASLADRAAGRSFPVRFLVLFFLRRAEAAARIYVAEATLTDGLWFDDELGTASGPADAALLSLRLRTLAAVLGTLLAPSGGRPGGNDHKADATRAFHGLAPWALVVAPGFPLPGPNDTS